MKKYIAKVKVQAASLIGEKSVTVEWKYLVIDTKVYLLDAFGKGYAPEGAILPLDNLKEFIKKLRGGMKGDGTQGNIIWDTLKYEEVKE